MKILVTGFEPWGLVRKNVSKELVREFERENQDPEIGFVILPVSDLGAESFKSYIKIKKPEIVVSLGHVPLSKTFRIENHAIVNGEKITSPLAGYLALSTGIQLADNIGDGYCNKLYGTTLSYTKKSIFIHVGSLVDREVALKNLMRIIKILKRIKTTKKNATNIQRERNKER